ncbi:hypothetical protein GJ496_011397 [Pomphorhynchus laevis]|nr:hypothetical protein GJ496_011397 [Pomphorhynchus laevis]
MALGPVLQSMGILALPTLHPRIMKAVNSGLSADIKPNFGMVYRELYRFHFVFNDSTHYRQHYSPCRLLKCYFKFDGFNAAFEKTTLQNRH